MGREHAEKEKTTTRNESSKFEKKYVLHKFPSLNQSVCLWLLYEDIDSLVSSLLFSLSPIYVDDVQRGKCEPVEKTKTQRMNLHCTVSCSLRADERRRGRRKRRESITNQGNHHYSNVLM